MDIGMRIRRVRQKRGLTLQQVAPQIRISAAGLSLLERGERQITIKRLKDISRVLNVELGVFFAREFDSTLTRIEPCTACPPDPA